MAFDHVPHDRRLERELVYCACARGLDADRTWKPWELSEESLYLNFATGLVDTRV